MCFWVEHFQINRRACAVSSQTLHSGVCWKLKQIWGCFLHCRPCGKAWQSYVLCHASHTKRKCWWCKMFLYLNSSFMRNVFSFFCVCASFLQCMQAINKLTGDLELVCPPVDSHTLKSPVKILPYQGMCLSFSKAVPPARMQVVIPSWHMYLSRSNVTLGGCDWNFQSWWQADEKSHYWVLGGVR